MRRRKRVPSASMKTVRPRLMISRARWPMRGYRSGVSPPIHTTGAAFSRTSASTCESLEETDAEDSTLASRGISLCAGKSARSRCNTSGRRGDVENFCAMRTLARSQVSRGGKRIMRARFRSAAGTRWAGTSRRRIRRLCGPDCGNATTRIPGMNCDTGDISGKTRTEIRCR